MAQIFKIMSWTGERRGNVVFVHGLGGHPYGTWQRGTDDQSFWPLWLGQDVPGLAVFSYGYELASDQLAWHGHAAIG